MRNLLVCAVAGGVLASSAFADTVIFQDNFNAEHGGTGILNYNAFANWTVSDGTVDLIGNGFFDFFPGNGLYVDLDGSTGNAGTMTTTSSLGLSAGMTYILQFDLGGSMRGDVNTAEVNVSVSNFNESFTFNSDMPLTHITRTFVANGDGFLSFAGSGGDNIGLILDNVQVTVVPLPTGAVLGGLGLGIAGVATRRRLSINRSR
jgi:hypothetical protein